MAASEAMLAPAVLRRHVDLLLEGTEAGVFGVDRAGRATVVTPSVAAMTGHALSDLVGRGMHEALHHSHADGQCYPRAACPIYAAFRDGETHSAREVFWRKDGSSFATEYTSTPLIEGGQLVGAVVVFRDLGHRQRACDRFARTLLGLQVPAPRPVVTTPGGGRDELPVGESAAFRATMELVRRVAAAPTTVLIEGESGTGKELVARALHLLSPRRGRPLVKVNCAALPATLIESELFGHERGAFTGAIAPRAGRFEQAEDGTLFLDEVGELPLDAQAKLLRVLQERELERVGGTRTIPVRARVVAATNRSLGALVAAGRFRADLHHRLNVFPVRVPPLRARREDIPLLVAHFVGQQGRRLGRALRGVSDASLRRLLAHDWPGNVRELGNVIERAALLCDGDVLEVPPFTPGEGAVPVVEARVDRATLEVALVRCGWKITGPRGAAVALGMHPNTLRYRMRRLGLTRP